MRFFLATAQSAIVLSTVLSSSIIFFTGCSNSNKSKNSETTNEKANQQQLKQQQQQQPQQANSLQHTDGDAFCNSICKSFKDADQCKESYCKISTDLSIKPSCQGLMQLKQSVKAEQERKLSGEGLVDPNADSNDDDSDSSVEEQVINVEVLPDYCAGDEATCSAESYESISCTPASSNASTSAVSNNNRFKGNMINAKNQPKQYLDPTGGKISKSLVKHYKNMTGDSKCREICKQIPLCGTKGSYCRSGQEEGVSGQAVCATIEEEYTFDNSLKDDDKGKSFCWGDQCNTNRTVPVSC
jgi:hypothetical protein